MKIKKIIILLVILSLGLTSLLKVTAVSAKEFSPMPLTSSEIQSLTESSAGQQDLLSFQAGSSGLTETQIALIVVGVFAVGIAAMLIFKGL